MRVAVVQLNTQDDVAREPGARPPLGRRRPPPRAPSSSRCPRTSPSWARRPASASSPSALDGAFPGPIVTRARRERGEARRLGPRRRDARAERRPSRARTTRRSSSTRRGDVAATYRKVHLFDVSLPDGTSLRESAATIGRRATPSRPRSCGVRVGLSICYDVRFPELYRRLVDQGARVVTVPAAFTLTTGKDHWHALLRARAIENQVYVLAPAQHGKHPRGRQTYGKSVIVDPWGEVVAQCSEGRGVRRGAASTSRTRTACARRFRRSCTASGDARPARRSRRRRRPRSRPRSSRRSREVAREGAVHPGAARRGVRAMARAASAASTHAVGVASGTDALELALRALGVGPGRRGRDAGAVVRGGGRGDRRDRARGRSSATSSPAR